MNILSLIAFIFLKHKFSSMAGNFSKGTTLTCEWRRIDRRSTFTNKKNRKFFR